MDLGLMQTIVGGVLGGGLIGLVEFLIRRHDEKNNRHDEILEAIAKLDEKINSVEQAVKDVDAKGDERYTLQARVRMLRFEDELQEGRYHSKDSWDQAISDCDIYKLYCSNHPGFKNGQTAATEEHIRTEYAKRLEKKDWSNRKEVLT